MSGPIPQLPLSSVHLERHASSISDFTELVRELTVAIARYLNTSSTSRIVQTGEQNTVDPRVLYGQCHTSLL